MPNTPKSLAMPSSANVNDGDIITIEGMYTRPSARSAAWWVMLLFGPALAVRHIPHAFRRSSTEPLNFFPHTRRDLFAPRELQRFCAKVT